MVLNQKLTAETLLSAPRRSPAVPNRNGSLALYTLSTHFFGRGTLKEVKVMNIGSRHSEQLCNGDKVHDAQWIPGTDGDVIYLESVDKGRTRVLVANGGDVTRDHYVVAEFDAPVSTLKLKTLEDGEVAFVVTGLVDKDGSLFNEETVEKKSTGRIYDSTYTRVWNEMYRSQKYSLWYNKLVQSDGKWTLTGELINLVNDPGVEAPAGMYDIIAEPQNCFDICQKGIAYLGRELTPPVKDVNFMSSLYFMPLESFSEPPPTEPRKVTLEPGTGYNVRISPDASHIALLHFHCKDVYNTRLYIASLDQLDPFDVFSLVTANFDEDYEPPSSFEFAGNSESIILQSQKHGHSVLSTLKLQENEKPKTFFSEGTVAAFYPLKEGEWSRLLVSSNSLIDSSLWQVRNVSGRADMETISSMTKNGSKYGLSPDMVNEFWFEGADDLCVHSFIVTPSDFDKTKKYPWVLLPHGGPVSAWMDAWSTRWNVAAWAEQGYVVVIPNITGSLGYGIDFIKRVNGEWGGRPFQDLLNLIEYLEKLPYLDQDKAILAGASYGGYLVSWFMGHDIIKKFCCVIWHDGMFSLPISMVQGDIVGDYDSFKGSPWYWENAEQLEKWNPAKPELLKNWKNAPPTIVIASEKDYRCPITDGIACFNVLQAHGVPSRFLTFPDEGHWVLGPENSLFWHQTVWDWMKRCVSGELARRPENVEI